MGNLYLGLSGFAYQGKIKKTLFSHFGVGADVGYAFALTNKLRFIPLVFVGGCQTFIFQYEGNNLLTMDSLSYVVMPSLLLNYQVTPRFALGLRVGYQFYSYNLPKAEEKGNITGLMALFSLVFFIK